MKRRLLRVLSDIVKRRFVLPPRWLHVIWDMSKETAPDRAVAGRTAKQAGLKLSGSVFRLGGGLRAVLRVGVDRESDQVS